jgi:MSHA biogenesis protein MshK
MRRSVLTVLLALARLPGASAQAQALPDPTRPAIGPGSGNAAAATPAQLQVVLIGRGPAARKVAVISGQTLRIGDKFDGAVLAAISENQVVLKNGNKTQVLKLFPVPQQRSGGSDGNVDSDVKR